MAWSRLSAHGLQMVANCVMWLFIYVPYLEAYHRPTLFNTSLKSYLIPAFLAYGLPLRLSTWLSLLQCRIL